MSRSSPDLKSGASRPSLSIRCIGKRNVSRVLTHEHRREVAGRRGTVTREDTWWTDMPSCWCHGTLRHAQVQHAQQSVPCLVVVVSGLCTHRCMAHPPSPPFSEQVLRLFFTKFYEPMPSSTSPMRWGSPRRDVVLFRRWVRRDSSWYSWTTFAARGLRHGWFAFSEEAFRVHRGQRRLHKNQVHVFDFDLHRRALKEVSLDSRL